MRKQLQTNLQRIADRMQLACDKAGRAPDDVRLLPVTKSVEAPVAAALFELGCHELAENRLEGLQAKRSAFAERGLNCRWHFIGQIQRNKAARILGLSHVIHSVDRQALLESLLRHAEADVNPTEIYLQVKLDDGEAKTGFAPSLVEAAIRSMDSSPKLILRGLMGMAPQAEDPKRRQTLAKAAFESLRQLADNLPKDAFLGQRIDLSMGMSADLEEAVAAGSNTLRVGRALFEGIDASPSTDSVGKSAAARASADAPKKRDTL